MREPRRAMERRYAGLGALIPFAVVALLLGSVSLYNSLHPGIGAFDPNAMPPTAAGIASETLPDGCASVESVPVVHRLCRAFSDVVRVTSDSSSR